MVVPPARGPTQGRRFNGRPAVSKTASGGSNPSAPAKHPRSDDGVQTSGRKAGQSASRWRKRQSLAKAPVAGRIDYGCRRESLGLGHKELLQRPEAGDAPRDVAGPETGGG